MPKGFLSLGRGRSINDSLIKEVVVINGKYFVNDIYGMSYQVDKKHYKQAKELVDNK